MPSAVYHPYVCLLLQDLYKSCARGGGVKRGGVCYGMLRAAACVDESDHHALMYVRHGQPVREEGVDAVCRLSSVCMFITAGPI